MGTNSLAMLSKLQTCHQNSFRFKEISRRTSLMQHCTRSVLWAKHTKRQLEQAVLVSGAHACVCRGNAQPDVDASIARGDAAALAFVVVIAKIHSTKQRNECQLRGYHSRISLVIIDSVYNTKRVRCLQTASTSLMV